MKQEQMAFKIAKKSFCKSMGYNFFRLSIFEEAQSTAYAHAMVMTKGNQSVSIRIVIQLMSSGKLTEAIKESVKKVENYFGN